VSIGPALLRPAPAYYEAPELFPALRPELWFQLARLLESRGLVTGKGARRLLAFIGDTCAVDEYGRIENMTLFIGEYRARVAAQRREAGRRNQNPPAESTVWADIGALVDVGLLRCTQAAAPQQNAAYRIAYPAADVAVLHQMSPLPGSLAEKLGLVDDPEPETTTRENNAPGEKPETMPCLNARVDQLHPPPGSPNPSPPADPSQRAPFRGDNSRSEEPPGMSILSLSRYSWIAQRGAGRVPGADEMSELAPLVGYSLRWMSAAQVRGLITDRVASAADLKALVRWRLKTEINAARNAARYAAEAAEQAEEADQRAAERAAALTAEAARAAERHAARQADPAHPLHQLRAEMRRRAADQRAAALLSQRPGRPAAEARTVPVPGPTAPAADPYDGELARIRRLMAEDPARAHAAAQAAASRAARQTSGRMRDWATGS
jgi:hypothetical protein